MFILQCAVELPFHTEYIGTSFSHVNQSLVVKHMYILSAYYLLGACLFPVTSHG